MSSATLTSLAMLKVKVDQGGDYLDYLQPFVLHVLVDKRPSPVTDRLVREHVLTEFGLDIPERAIQIVLRRLSRRHPLRKESGTYQIVGTLPDPGISTRKADADRHIQAVVAELIQFSSGTAKPIQDRDGAVSAICAFLAEFDIPCLRAYLRGTALPETTVKHQADIVLVSQFLVQLKHSNPERFDSFMILVQGHMLANALLCPDLRDAPKTYKGLTFYLDTPLLVRLLGLEGEPRRIAMQEMITLVRNLEATVATFSHSRAELERVVRGAANHIDAPDGRGAIVSESRRSGTTRSDLLLLASRLDEELQAAAIEAKCSPPYERDLQIDEKQFGQILEDEVSYFNDRARDDDINSVRSIYVLRAGISPATVEKCKAVLVTSNAAFARAAFQYGRDFEASREVSSVITDFSVANMAWLKAPMGAPTLPAAETLAFAYAALQPSKPLLNKFLAEIDRLEAQGKITPRDHQLLRSSPLAQDELVRLTLGEEDALTEQTVSVTLERVAKEIKKEESDKLTAEQAAHEETRRRLERERTEREQIQQRLYWRCYRRAQNCSWVIAIVVGAALLVGIAVGLGLRSSQPALGWVLTILFALATLAGAIDLLFDFSVRQMRERLEQSLRGWFLTREATATGVDLQEFSGARDAT